MKIRPARPSDHDSLVRMRVALWPDGSAAEHATEVTAILSGHAPTTTPLAIFVAELAGEGEVVGFVEADLRSHADGCNPIRPVGFVEGWYVVPAHRHQGIGRALVAAAEEWSRSHGCLEIASDTWISHEESQRAHEALGFEVVDRCVHYRKDLR